MANKENIRKWVDALRSGEFKQGSSSNYQPSVNTHCCLGVACAVAVANGASPTEFSGTTRESHWAQRGGLIKPIREWLGIVEYDPPIAQDGAYAVSKISASYANDVLGWSFSQIADAIEKRYLTDGE